MGDIHIRIDEEPIIIRMEPASVYPIPFTSLTDAPTTYHDQANKFVKVKAAEDGLEFVVAAGLTDELVKYDSADPTAGYLADKIVGEGGTTVAEGTGADENKAKISSHAAGSDAETITTIGAILTGASADTPADTDTFSFYQALTSGLKKITWANIKSVFALAGHNHSGTYQPTGSYEVTTNKETSALDTSTSKYPCNNVVKSAVDNKASNSFVIAMSIALG